jgi:hypothetical protein
MTTWGIYPRSKPQHEEILEVRFSKKARSLMSPQAFAYILRITGGRYIELMEEG